jgi:hypothetical protein
MGIGRNSFKAAKEKAKAEGKKIRDAKPQQFMSKSFARIPAKGVNEIKPRGIDESPANGNAFGLAMQKTGGDYKAAKAMLDASPANYGSGSPFKLMKSKIFKK